MLPHRDRGQDKRPRRTLPRASPDPRRRLSGGFVSKLPAIGALIERAEAVTRWLEIATRCECSTLDACALFDERALGPLARAGDVDERGMISVIAAPARQNRAGRAAAPRR